MKSVNYLARVRHTSSFVAFSEEDALVGAPALDGIAEMSALS